MGVYSDTWTRGLCERGMESVSGGCGCAGGGCYSLDLILIVPLTVYRQTGGG